MVREIFATYGELSIKYKGERKVELHNFMEEIVYLYLDEVLEKYHNICKCEKCKLDMAAYALNHLSPKYAATEKGKLYNKVKEMESQHEVDVIRELTKAIEIVSRKPRHDNF